MSEQDNRIVWDYRPGHYEVWYCTLSHRASGTGFWIRYTLEAPLPGHGEAYAQLWFARFDPADPSLTFGFNKRFPIGDLHETAHPFSVAIGEAIMRHDGMIGALSGAGHEVSWNFSWRPAATTHAMLPGFAYKSGLVITKVLSPNNNVPASGEIIVDGRRYDLSSDPAGQTHVWGKKHAYAWGWAHCNAFDDPDASIEALSVRLKRGSVILPTLTLFKLDLGREVIDFREAWRFPLARGSFQTGRYHFLGAGADTKVEADFTCRPDDMVLTEYVDPDGDPAFCHNTCCGDAAVTVWKRSPFVGRWREHRRLRATNTAHFEWGGRAGDVLNVRKNHVTLG
ncbi:MAG: hypothetical protein EXR72_18525 [Myxococcales bacterium]|nr:hypothetical protein [Myxococcales bacterium]